MRKTRVALIFPKLTDSIDRLYNDFWLTNKIKGLLQLGKTNYTPPLSLLMLAAVTPPEIEVVIIDERLEEINFDMRVDLVGISLVTRAAYQAYDIADRFRQRGVKVVLGGIHPTVLPEEALIHADSVVIGEGDGSWPQLLQDFHEGSMRKIYKANYSFPVETLPFPRRELLRQPDLYLTTKVITATRGCPYNCTFCTVGTTLSKMYRKFPISKIIEEVESLPGNFVLFMDDNIGVDTKFAKELFSALKSLQIKWFGSISVNALEDTHLVKLIADSGCKVLEIGFESISSETLKLMGKHRTNNPDRYKLLIKRLHDHGIAIVGTFILGYDSDTPDTYKQLADFIGKTCIEMPSLNILIPYPGTSIYRQFEREGRILDKKWNLYDTSVGNVLYRPKNMTREEMIERFLSLEEKVFSYRSVLRRLLRTGYFDPLLFAWSLHYNYQHRQNLTSEKAAYERARYKQVGF